MRTIRAPLFSISHPRMQYLCALYYLCIITLSTLSISFRLPGTVPTPVSRMAIRMRLLSRNLYYPTSLHRNYIIQYIRKWALGSRGSGRLSTLASLAARALRVHVLRWGTILLRCRVSRCNTQHLLNCSGAWRLCRWDGQWYSGRLEITNYYSLVPTASLAGFASAPARMVRAKNAFGGVAMDLCMPVSHENPRKQTCFRHTVTSGCVRAWPHL